MSTTLSLNPIVNVIINLSPLSAIRNGFDLGLIIGSAAVIPKTERIRIYTDTNSMLEDGFKNTDPEYKAAQLYFASPGQPTRLAVGRQDLTAVPAETALDAVTACRLANSDWYAVMVCEEVKEDILAVAEYIETATPHSTFFYTTADEDVLANIAGTVFDKLKGLLYKRSIGMYSTTVNAVASIMGYAMGANNGTRNSAYTLAYKTMPGVSTENLTNTQVTNIKAKNGNLYLSRGGQYNVFEQGHVANGTSFDELINLDKLANDIQLSVMDALYQAPKIPQTEAGVTQLINAISEPCRQAVNIGFIAPGLWKGQSILNLKNGDVLQEGFLIQAESINSQTQADRDARKAPYIYVAIKLAGAIEYVVIRVDVNR